MAEQTEENGELPQTEVMTDHYGFEYGSKDEDFH